MRYVGWTLLGFVAGAIALTAFIGFLDPVFRSYSTDMPGFLFYSAPAGAIFGSLTGCVLALASKRKYTYAACVSIIAAVVLGFFHINMWSLAAGDPATTPAYALFQAGPGLLWSVLLFVLGVKYFLKTR
jgi:hypothetical protein